MLLGGNMPVLGEYLDVVETAKLLGVHWETVKRLCREGNIPAQKVHNKWLIHKRDIDAFAKVYKKQRGKRPK